MMPIQRNHCYRGECPTGYITWCAVFPAAATAAFTIVATTILTIATAAAATVIAVVAFVYDFIAQQPNNIVTIQPTTRYYHCAGWLAGG